MGVVKGVGIDAFPRQSDKLNSRVAVCFDYDTSRTIGGTIVRYDYEEPWVAVLRLDDGRFVLASECQYQFAK